MYSAPRFSSALFQTDAADESALSARRKRRTRRLLQSTRDTSVHEREALWLANQRRRWMLPDPSRWLEPDGRKWNRPEPAWNPAAFHERKYSADQPRVPAGNPDGGRWTSGGGGVNDPRVISDATPDNEAIPGAQYAQNRSGRGSVPVRIGGQIVEVEPGQAARLAVAEARAENAIRQVRQVDPTWRPTPSAYGIGVESEIQKNNDLAVEAQARVDELARVGIGPGPFADDSIPARGPGYSTRVGERDEINRIGRETGCHTCGTRDPGTTSGNFVRDHQPPNAWNSFGWAQRIFPHCATCSARQGNWLSRYRGER